MAQYNQHPIIDPRLLTLNTPPSSNATSLNIDLLDDELAIATGQTTYDDALEYHTSSRVNPSLVLSSIDDYEPVQGAAPRYATATRA